MQLIKFEFIKKQLTTETKTSVSELPKLVRDYIPDQIVKNNLIFPRQTLINLSMGIIKLQ